MANPRDCRDNLVAENFSGKTRDCVAVEAVISERVSALHVPCSAGKYREIADFGLEMAETPALSR
jgi:hypothetical protein